MKPKSFAGMRCSIAGALELIGDRWSLLLIRDLSLGLSRYDDLRASTGIPAATLAARLKHLAAAGIIERVRYQDRPPRDEYRLTLKGRDLWKKLLSLLDHPPYAGVPTKCETHRTEHVCDSAEAFLAHCPDGGCDLPCNQPIRTCAHAPPHKARRLWKANH